MLISMTGYGEAHGKFEGATYIVEVKAVNNRYFKVRVRLPDSVLFLEKEIEELLREEVSRGMLNYTLRIKGVSRNLMFDIDEEVLKGYIDCLNSVIASTEGKYPMDISGLLSIPGVLVPSKPDEELAASLREVVLRITHEALEQLKEMQAAEGAALAADLQEHCKEMRHNIKQILALSKTAPKHYQEKLKENIDVLLADANVKLDEKTLAREVALFAERVDISEEIARLDSHLKQFEQSCQVDGRSGRRLDFITQEMLREANTIASKASDTQIIHLVVDIKCNVDRIKEQVQNVK